MTQLVRFDNPFPEGTTEHKVYSEGFYAGAAWGIEYAKGMVPMRNQRNHREDFD